MCGQDVTAQEGAGRAGSFPLLLSGSRGASVRHLQEKLRAAGFDPGPVDGIYGLLTAAAVRELQHSFGLREDGLAGPEVWRVLTDPEALLTRPRIRLQAGEQREALPLTYRLAWPRLSERPGVPGQPGGQGQPVFLRTSGSGWSRTILAASMPHLSGVVTYILATKSPPVAPGPLWELLPLDDLAVEAARAGCDRWVLLPARVARELSSALAQAPLRDGPSPACRAGRGRRQGREQGQQSRGQDGGGSCGLDPSPGRKRSESDAPGQSGGNGGGWKGLLVDASGFRLPAQLPELLALLAALREMCAGPGGEEGEAGGHTFARVGGARLEVVLPAVPAAAGSFWRAFRQACAQLAGRADRLWLSAFRRPEDWVVAGRPLHLVELERMLALARETWVPWRIGVVLPAGGWWADGRPLTRREALALRQRQRQPGPRAAAATAAASPALATSSLPGVAGPHAHSPRDAASGLLLLGLAETGDGPEAYLADKETWRVLLRCAHAAGVSGLAVYPWGEEHPSLWEVFPEFSGRLGRESEASPPAGGI